MRLEIFPSPHALAGGLPPGLGLSLAAQLLRPLRWVAGGSLFAGAAVTAAVLWLAPGEGVGAARAAVRSTKPLVAAPVALAVAGAATAAHAVPAILPQLPATEPVP